MSILHAAAARNDQAKVMKLLAHGYDVNRRLKGTGATPLIHAAADRRTNADMLQVLVEHGADPHLTTEDNNQTALHKAAQRGQVDKVAYLLSLGMDVNQRDANGYAPILFAAYSKSDEKRELLQSLLTSGADAYRPTMYNETTVSACAGDFDLLRLFERERVMDILHWTPLMAATAWGTVDSMNALLKQKHDFRLRDKSCRTLWHLAIETGDVSKTELLYGQSDMPMDEDIGAFPNVFYAVMHDHSEMLNWLIEVGTDIQAQHALGSALEICAQMGASACLRILLDNQVFDHDVMNRAVSCAGNVVSIKLLLDAGANIDHVDPEGYSALKTAVESDDLERAQFLLDNEANPDLPHIGETPLIIAVSHDHIDMVRLLIQKGANVNLQTRPDMWFALQYVRSEEMVQMLLDAGAATALSDAGGTTAGKDLWDERLIAMLEHH